MCPPPDDLDDYSRPFRRPTPCDATPPFELPTPDTDTPELTGHATALDAMSRVSVDMLHHLAAIREAVGDPIRWNAIIPLGGPTNDDVARRYANAVRALYVPKRAPFAQRSAPAALLADWGHLIPGWIECDEAARPLVALLHRLFERYYPHQLRIAVPTHAGPHGVHALADVVQECCNPRGAATGILSSDGAPIRHGDPLVWTEGPETDAQSARAARWFVRGQDGGRLGVVAGATTQWLDRHTVHTWRSAWVETTSQCQGTMPGGIALHHPAVPYALVLIDGPPRALDAIQCADLLP